MGPLYMAEYPWLIGDISPHVYCNCSLLGPALLSPNNFCSPIFESPRNGGNSPAVPRWKMCHQRYQRCNCNNPMQLKELHFEQSWQLKIKMIIQQKTPLSCSPLGCFPIHSTCPKKSTTKIHQLLPLNFACKGAVLAPPLVPRMRGLSLPAWKTCTRTLGSRAPSPRKSLKMGGKHQGPEI